MDNIPNSILQSMHHFIQYYFIKYQNQSMVWTKKWPWKRLQHYLLSTTMGQYPHLALSTFSSLCVCVCVCMCSLCVCMCVCTWVNFKCEPFWHDQFLNSILCLRIIFQDMWLTGLNVSIANSFVNEWMHVFAVFPDYVPVMQQFACSLWDAVPVYSTVAIYRDFCSLFFLIIIIIESRCGLAVRR